MSRRGGRSGAVVRWPGARLASPALLLLAALSGCAQRGAPPDLTRTFDPDSIPEAYRYSTAALMWPGATRAFQVTPAGDLYNGEAVVRIRPSAAGAAADSPRVVAYEDRWLPVTRWTRRAGGVRWDFETVALPEPAPRDTGLLVSLLVQATNLTDAPQQARLAMALEPPAPSPLFVAFDAAGDPSRWMRWGAGASADTVFGWSAMRGGAPQVAQEWRLEPGGARQFRVVLPAYPTPARALARWARVPHARRVAEARDYWRTELGRCARFELGDPELENAFRAALVVLLGCRERRGEEWVPIGGPFHYRDVWLRDGARAVQALALAGHVTEARKLARGLASLQWPQGAFLSQKGQLDGTGQFLWALGEVFLRPGVGAQGQGAGPAPTAQQQGAGRARAVQRHQALPSPADSLGPILDAALRGWRWCERERGETGSLGPPFADVLPFADPRDNELVYAQLVGNDAWAIAGYGTLARLLAAAGREADAQAVAASRARYLADFERALERSGSPDLPPSWQGEGHDWGNLAIAYPCRVLPAEHPRCAALARRYWRAAGGPGIGYYHDPDSLHYYLAADLGSWALLAGRRAEADRVLDALVRWRSASGGAAELFSRTSRDYGRNLPPHATGAAALVTLVRNALIFDDGDTLQLTLGARAAWWRGGRIRGAPTRWGVVDLSFEQTGAAAVWTWTPVPVWTALTLPPRRRLAGPLEAPLRPGPTPQTVLAPPGTGHARVRIVGGE